MLGNNNIFNNIHIYLIVFSAFFFSYIPFFYVLEYIGLSKGIAYLILICLTFLALLFYIYMGKLQVSRESLIMFGFSLFFALYAAISHVLTINYFNDYQTLIAVSILNPLYILQATLLTNNKKHILWFLYALSFLYFVIVMTQWLQGTLKPSSEDTIFIQVFEIVDTENYQTVNRYLGLMCVLTVGIFSQRNWLIYSLKIVLVTLCMFFMLKIGGRAAIISLVMVLFCWFILFKIKFESIYFILSLILAIMGSYILLLSLDKIIIFLLQSDITSFNRFASLLMDTDGSGHRGHMFTKAVEQFTFSLKNLFFGGGMNSFSIFTKEYNVDIYPHNIFLEVLAEYGVFGFIMFMLPVFYLFKTRRYRIGSYIGNKDDRVFFMVFLYFLIIQMSNGSLRNIWFFTFITFLLLPAPRKEHITSTFKR